MRLLACVFLVVLCGVVYGAGGDVPPRLKAAQATLDASIKRADQEAAQKKLLAKRAFLKEVSAAFDEAMARKDIDTANRCNEIKKQVEAEIGGGEKESTPPPPANRLGTGKIPASAGWVNVKKVRRGEVLKVEATGEWCISKNSPEQYTYLADGTRKDGYNEGPGGSRDGAMDMQWGRGHVIGRIVFDDGSERRFFVGKEYELTAEKAGTFEVRCNVPDGRLNHCSGEMSLTLTAK